MLDGMRKATQGPIGKVVMAVLMGLLIVSFAVWGVGDMLHGFTPDTVANFERESGIRVRYGTYESIPEMLAKVAGGNSPPAALRKAPLKAY